MSKASRQKYGPRPAGITSPIAMQMADESDARFRADLIERTIGGSGYVARRGEGMTPDEVLEECVTLDAQALGREPAIRPAPAPLLTALRDLTRVMAAETLRQMAHCSRCDRPARFSSGFTGSLSCQAHRDEQAALGQASFTALPVPVMAERLYAFVMGEE